MPAKYESLNTRQTKAEMIKAYNELLKKIRREGRDQSAGEKVGTTEKG